MVIDSNGLFVILAMPALFGLTLLGEGVYNIAHYESGWFKVLLGACFLAIVAFGYFYLRG